MGRTIFLTPLSDRFIQGENFSNVEMVLYTLGGNDTVYLNRIDIFGGGNRVETGSGRDRVENYKEFGNLIVLGSGDDTYIGRGFGNRSGNPYDLVYGGTGNDIMSVQTFKSRYFGEAGNDSFFSVGWQNTFNGGSGIDSISYAPRGQNDTGVTINLAQGFARTGRNQTETLISIENATGSRANDTIVGSKGANRIEGAGGIDDLTGGAGADTFVFSRVSHSQIENRQIDLIFDFRRSEGDRIDVSGIDANENRSGNQNFTFIGESAFSGKAGELRIQSLSDGVRITGDVDGDRRADFYIGVLDMASLRAGDFIL